jgi:hypothetical protein
MTGRPQDRLLVVELQRPHHRMFVSEPSREAGRTVKFIVGKAEWLLR